jgi:hypothetical protein
VKTGLSVQVCDPEQSELQQQILSLLSVLGFPTSDGIAR